MGRIIPLLLLLALTTTTFAQEIVDSTKMWSSMEEHCQPWGSTYSTDYLRFYQDTLINDTTYQKVWISEDENYENWNFYGAFIREENNRVYYRQVFGQEGLIYDFNLEIGDSVLVDNPRAVGSIYLSLVEIDSIETVVGLKERWKLISDDYPDSEYWIRGIGSETGILNSSSGIFGGLCGLYTLLCQKENDELVFINPDYESCFLYTTGGAEIAETDNLFVLQSDNSSVSLTFLDEKYSDKVIVLSDISGNVITKLQTRDIISTIPLINNLGGIYIVSVFVGGRVVSQKFVKY